MRELFKKIQLEEDAFLDITREKVSNGRVIGGRAEQEYYSLKFKYNECPIIMDCMLGQQSVARITCLLPKNNDLHNFSIATRSHIAVLFWAYKNRFTLETEDSMLSKFIKHNAAYKELNALSKRTKFQPAITGINKGDSYILLTEYHLFFPQRNESFMPLIQFYKDLIDYFK